MFTNRVGVPQKNTFLSTFLQTGEKNHLYVADIKEAIQVEKLGHRWTLNPDCDQTYRCILYLLRFYNTVGS